MKICITERTEFELCGYSVETELENNDKSIKALYYDYFHKGKAELIEQIAKSSNSEYYGLSWYTYKHEKYCYIIGKEVTNQEKIPSGALLINIPKAQYAFEMFDPEDNIIKAWSSFFYKDIPESGYKPNYEHGLWFEYYPDGVSGKYELWAPVVKNNV